MARGAIHPHRPKRGPAEIQANLTPMIDVTFLLIVFFVLVSQIVEVENVDLHLPLLSEPASDLPGDEQRTVINVVPGVRGAAEEYRLGGRAMSPDADGLRRLQTQLADLLAANPNLRINLRADRSTHYKAVQPVLEAIMTAAGHAGERLGEGALRPKVNLVVVRDD